MAERIKDEYVENLPPCIGKRFDSKILERGEEHTVRDLIELVRIIINDGE